MNLSNLSIVILVAAIALFVASLISRRAGINTPTLQLVVKVLRVVILVLVASYFYIRFVG